MPEHRRTFLKQSGLGTLAVALPHASAAEEPKRDSPGQTLAVSGTSGVAPKDAYLADLVEMMKTPWPKNRTVNIVFHGHSVPAGFFKTPFVDTFNAYPHLVHKGLKKRFPHAVINGIVTAIGGENSVPGAERFEAEVLCHRPDLLTIDYALNDRGPGLERARAAWGSMIERAAARGIRVILLTPTPDEAHRPDDLEEPLNQHAEQIRNLAAEYGVGLVDSLAGFDRYQKQGRDVKDLLSQINHPNRKGHDIVTRRFLDWFPA